jgi:GTPase SAR1 family protein
LSSHATMNCCVEETNNEDRRARDISKQIDKAIRDDKLNEDKKIKLLLLGPGDAGKSTFLKQLRVIHDQKFSNIDLEKFKAILKDNVLLSMKAMLAGATLLKVQIPEEYQPLVKEIQDAETLTEAVGTAIRKVWKAQFMQDLWQRKHEIAVYPWANYYFENVKRIASKNFVPKNEDILRAKLRTTGIHEITLAIGEYQLTVVDVGGQRNERRKWLHCFENVTAVIYFAALDEYDMCLEEDPEVNRFDESLHLWSELSGSLWLKERSFILFLNKSDLFREKIKVHPLSKYFKDYTGDNSYDDGVNFIRKKYDDAFKGARLYRYVTCAVDTDNIRKVFESVKNTILIRRLEYLGMAM